VTVLAVVVGVLLLVAMMLLYQTRCRYSRSSSAR
jgi:hypothetical protein